MKERIFWFALLVTSFVGGGLIVERKHAKVDGPTATIPGRYQFISNQGIIYRGDTSSGQVAQYHSDTAKWVVVTGEPSQRN